MGALIPVVRPAIGRRTGIEPQAVVIQPMHEPAVRMPEDHALLRPALARIPHAPECVERLHALRHVVAVIQHLVLHQVRCTIRLKAHVLRQRGQKRDVFIRHPFAVVVHPFVAICSPKRIHLARKQDVEQMPVVVAHDAVRAVFPNPADRLVRIRAVIHVVARAIDGVYRARVLFNRPERRDIRVNIGENQ